MARTRSMELRLSNPKRVGMRPIFAEALVDTDVETGRIPERVAGELEFDEIERREVVTADGRHLLVPYVGPIKIQYQQKTCYTGALVMGDTVVLGARPLEELDLPI